MRGRAFVLVGAVAAGLLGGCACRARCAPTASVGGTLTVVAPAPDAAAEARRTRAKALVDRARARTEYLPMASEEDARAAVPSMKSFALVPNLIRIAAVLPKTTEAEMLAWDALRKEGTIDKRLLSETFWVVSQSNECGHCMGHILFSTELMKVPERMVFDIDRPGVDARRAATFAFAKKVSRTPERVTKEDVQGLREWFTDAQIVELIYAINRYRTMNTLAEAFGSPLESINVFDPRNRKAKPEAKEEEEEEEEGEEEEEKDAAPDGGKAPGNEESPKPPSEKQPTP
jgi:alkylhydroperoxidase family enzyme